MKKILLGILLMFQVVATAGNEQGGGGIAENNLLYAFHNLEFFIDVCLNSHQSCTLNDKEYGLLLQIQNSLAEERKNKNLIVIASEEKNPGFFIIEGLVRIAKTEYRVGAPIYINADLLYPKAMVASPSSTHLLPHDRPLDIPLAAALLVHELGHHQGERDHTVLDILGTKVQTVLRTYTQELDGGPDRRYLLVNAYEYLSMPKSDLIARDEEKIVVLSPWVSNLLVCKDGKAPTSYSFWNLHWEKETGTPTRVRMPLKFRVSLKCATREWTEVHQLREASMDLFVRKDKSEKWKFEDKPLNPKILN